MLSTHSGEEEITAPCRLEPAAMFSRGIVREELLRAIREVYEGRQFIDPAVAPLLAQREGHRSLTNRELEVLRLVAKGFGNKEVAAALNIARGDRKTSCEPRIR